MATPIECAPKFLYILMSTPYRILFLGTPEFAGHQLECLIDSPLFELAGVITQPARAKGRKLKLQASPVELLARQHNLPYIATPRVDQHLNEIADFKAYAAVVVAFGQLLSTQFLQVFEHRVFNIHASLLPRWRGAAPIQACLAAGDPHTGVCLQKLVKKMDAGPVIGSRTLALQGHETAHYVHDQLKYLAPELLTHELFEFLSGRLEAQAQNEELVTFAPKLQKQQAFIDWSQSAKQIYNQLRAWSMNGSISTPWPPVAQPAVTPPVAQPAATPAPTAHSAARERMKIWKAQPLDENITLPFRPGDVFFVGADFFLVACGKGALKVLEVQLPSKKPMPVSEFLKGHHHIISKA